MFNFEKERFKNVLIKLAKGHAKFENSEPLFEEPASISMIPLESMTKEQTQHFFAPIELNKLPEVGSRASQQVALNIDNKVHSLWTTVQENNYRYSVIFNFGVMVRIVIWEYLAVEIIWD